MSELTEVIEDKPFVDEYELKWAEERAEELSTLLNISELGAVCFFKRKIEEVTQLPNITVETVCKFAKSLSNAVESLYNLRSECDNKIARATALRSSYMAKSGSNGEINSK